MDINIADDAEAIDHNPTLTHSKVLLSGVVERNILSCVIVYFYV